MRKYSISWMNSIHHSYYTKDLKFDFNFACFEIKSSKPIFKISLDEDDFDLKSNSSFKSNFYSYFTINSYHVDIMTHLMI